LSRETKIEFAIRVEAKNFYPKLKAKLRL